MEIKPSDLGALPPDWKAVKFGVITKVRQGLQIAISERLTKPTLTSQEYITIQSINRQNQGREYVESPSARVTCKSDDVLMTRTGNTGIVVTGVEGAFHNNFFLIDFERKELDSIFLVNYLRSPRVQHVILTKAGASTIPDLNHNDFYSIDFPLAPLPEQKKIAQILSTWDKAITTTEKLLANSQQQKKALMQQLLTGKKRFYSNGNYFYSVREGFAKSKLGALPSDWKVELIKKHLWYQEGPGVRNHQFTEQGVKLFNGTNIQFNKIDLSNTTTHISEEECIGAYKHFLVDDGDLLIACSGISVDRFDEKIAFASSAHLPLCMNTSTMRFKPLSGGVDITYFHYFMQSLVFKNQIRRQATGSAQLNFGPSHVGKCFVVIPSLEEQQKIATVLSSADQEISALQQKLNALKQEKKALMQQLLTGKRRVKIDNKEVA
ncbi:MAG: restriction endonuclease subunit S [Methyloprofundus sp.]|nr:restriction endonuclease subunit S [Methyloprofundus sp.]